MPFAFIFSLSLWLTCNLHFVFFILRVCGYHMFQSQELVLNWFSVPKLSWHVKYFITLEHVLEIGIYRFMLLYDLDYTVELLY